LAAAGAHLIIARGRVRHPLQAIADGAVKALRNGKSLLPADVTRIEGPFGRGDAVVVRGPDGAEIGRGLIAYDAADADKIKDRSSADILSILGFGGRTEMIHRDDLVLGGE
jgi:glutamate 5-kinase